MTDRNDETNQFEQGEVPVAAPVVAPVAARSFGPRQDLVRVGLVVAACFVLVLAATLVRAASPVPSNLPVDGAGAPAADVESDEDDEDETEDAFDNEDLDEDDGDQGDQGDAKDGRGFGAITIRTIVGTRVGLATEDGWIRAIEVTPETVIRRGDTAATLADLKVGDEVRIRQKRNSDGTFTIVAIVAKVPRTAGEVTGVNGDTITVKGRGGAAITITVTGSTTYTLGPNAAAKSDVKVGSRIAAQGERGASGTFRATAIRIALAEVSGEVTAKAAGSISVKQRDGTSKTIHVGVGTTFRVRGSQAAAPGLADIAVGNRVSAQGNLRADGSLDAVVVQTAKVKAPKAPKPSASPGG